MKSEMLTYCDEHYEGEKGKENLYRKINQENDEKQFNSMEVIKNVLL